MLSGFDGDNSSLHFFFTSIMSNNVCVVLPCRISHIKRKVPSPDKTITAQTSANMKFKFNEIDDSSNKIINAADVTAANAF